MIAGELEAEEVTDSPTDTLGKEECVSSFKSLIMAEPTGLEPATSDVTGRRSNQLNYDSAKIFLMSSAI